jgi:putative transcriptional regulator
VATVTRIALKEILARRERQLGRRITYADISQATGVSTNTISNMANNRQDLVSLRVVNKLCDFLECTPADLLIREPDQSQPT